MYHHKEFIWEVRPGDLLRQTFLLHQVVIKLPPISLTAAAAAMTDSGGGITDLRQ